MSREPFTEAEERLIRATIERDPTIGLSAEWMARLIVTLDRERATHDRAMERLLDHQPEIGSWIDDSSWLECSCGWDSSKPGAPSWSDHLIRALANP